ITGPGLKERRHPPVRRSDIILFVSGVPKLCRRQSPPDSATVSDYPFNPFSLPGSARSLSKDPGLMLELNSGPSCCAATVLTTVPPCCLYLKLVSFKLSKEMVLLQRLQEGEAERVTVNLEQGNPLQMIQLPQSPWVDRFRVCLDLVRLLHFLSQSPLVSGSLKLTDLDDASAEETTCHTDTDCTLQFPHRNFTLPCSAWGVCEGLNEKRNIYNAYRYFFTYLLPHQAPPGLTHLVDRIMNATGELKADINQTLEAFEHILHLYKSDLHLENLSPSIIRDHTVMRGMGTSGNVEYRCWPSCSQQGCVLSVHSCNSFTLTGQKTWTGRLLASFRSGFSHLVPDGTSEVYVKKTKVGERQTRGTPGLHHL
uniref:Protein kinase domain containing, cytoplasmic b n=1 Tax=Pundamilia nyererei TaxID=303518 RepID=A0A3B4FY33_9CICH